MLQLIAVKMWVGYHHKHLDLAMLPRSDDMEQETSCKHHQHHEGFGGEEQKFNEEEISFVKLLNAGMKCVFDQFLHFLPTP